MGNSPNYRGNPSLYAARARLAAQQEADFAAAVAALAEAEAQAAEVARTEADAALVLPITRRVKPAPKSTEEI